MSPVFLGPGQVQAPQAQSVDATKDMMQSTMSHHRASVVVVVAETDRHILHALEKAMVGVRWPGSREVQGDRWYDFPHTVLDENDVPLPVEADDALGRRLGRRRHIAHVVVADGETVRKDPGHHGSCVAVDAHQCTNGSCLRLQYLWGEDARWLRIVALERKEHLEDERRLPFLSTDRQVREAVDPYLLTDFRRQTTKEME